MKMSAESLYNVVTSQEELGVEALSQLKALNDIAIEDGKAYESLSDIGAWSTLISAMAEKFLDQYPTAVIVTKHLTGRIGASASFGELLAIYNDNEADFVDE